ncbi:hypothetical protein HK102_000832 [Quaeritorhiza haematococci]|nr:hypothetical protein HK102_000832 [Quaeritorhiza haematococci]
MFGRLTELVSSAVEVLTAAPYIKSREEIFRDHWNHVQRYYETHRQRNYQRAQTRSPRQHNGGHRNDEDDFLEGLMTVSDTNIPYHLDCMVKYIKEEEEEMLALKDMCEGGEMDGKMTPRSPVPFLEEAGPCLEYLLQNRLLDTMVDRAQEDDPPGVCLQILHTFSSLLTTSHHQLLPESCVRLPLIRLVTTCHQLADLGEIDSTGGFIDLSPPTVFRASPNAQHNNGISPESVQPQPGPASLQRNLKRTDVKTQLVRLIHIVFEQIEVNPHLIGLFFDRGARVRVGSRSNLFAGSATTGLNNNSENKGGNILEMGVTAKVGLLEGGGGSFPFLEILLDYVSSQGLKGKVAREAILMAVRLVRDEAVRRLERKNRQGKGEATREGFADERLRKSLLSLAEYMVSDSCLSETLVERLAILYKAMITTATPMHFSPAVSAQPIPPSPSTPATSLTLPTPSYDPQHSPSPLTPSVNNVDAQLSRQSGQEQHLNTSAENDISSRIVSAETRRTAYIYKLISTIIPIKVINVAASTPTPAAVSTLAFVVVNSSIHELSCIGSKRLGARESCGGVLGFLGICG